MIRSMLDLLFNLLMIFMVLFLLAFMLINTSDSEDTSLPNRNDIIITMRWEANCDIDLWLMLPDNRTIFYGNREEPPAFLDIDITSWRGFTKPDGNSHVVKDNEEIITIRGVLMGEYIVNAHGFNLYEETNVAVEIVVHDVKNKRMIYADKRVINENNREEHFVRFKVLETNMGFRIGDLSDSMPINIVGQGLVGNR